MYKVYRNVTRKCWSLSDLEWSKHGRVVDHPLHCVGEDCEFRVQPGGRDRVRRVRRKDVHAWVQAQRIRQRAPRGIPKSGYEQLYYNPYVVDGFVRKADLDFGFERIEVLVRARYVIFRRDGTVWALDPKSNGTITEVLKG